MDGYERLLAIAEQMTALLARFDETARFLERGVFVLETAFDVGYEAACKGLPRARKRKRREGGPDLKVVR